MIGFTRALAKEVGPQGIRVNCLTPAMIRGETTANCRRTIWNRCASATR